MTSSDQELFYNMVSDALIPDDVRKLAESIKADHPTRSEKVDELLSAYAAGIRAGDVAGWDYDNTYCNDLRAIGSEASAVREILSRK